MYALLKENTFYLMLENDSLFLKNNFGNIIIKTPNSYKFFKAFLPYLDGKHEIGEVIESIKNENLKKFYKKLIEVMKSKKFLLFSTKEIELSEYNDKFKTALYYKDDLDILGKSREDDIKIYVYSQNDGLNSIFERTFSGSFLVFTETVCQSKYGNLKIFVDDELQSELFIFKKNNIDAIYISSNKNNLNDLDEGIFDLPLHIMEVIAAIVRIELDLSIYDVTKKSFFYNDYCFDFRTLSGKQIN